MAIETVYVWNNTSIVQDEVLAQRLGLIPLAIDPRKLQLKQCTRSPKAQGQARRSPVANLFLGTLAPEDAPTDLNTVVFNLIARCERRKDVKKGELDPAKIYTGADGTSPPSLRVSRHLGSPYPPATVLSSQIEFDPKGSQAELFAQNPPRAAVGGILLAKMRGGQVSLLSALQEMHLSYSCLPCRSTPTGNRRRTSLQQRHWEGARQVVARWYVSGFSRICTFAPEAYFLPSSRPSHRFLPPPTYDLRPR